MDSLPNQSLWIEVDEECGTIIPIGDSDYKAKFFLEKLTEKLPRIVSKPIVVQHEQMTNEKFTLFVDDKPVHVSTNANTNAHKTISYGAHLESQLEADAVLQFRDHGNKVESRTKKTAAPKVNGDNESVPFIDADYKGLDKTIKDPIFRAIARDERIRSG